MFVQTIYMHNARFSLLSLVHVPFPNHHYLALDVYGVDVYRYTRVEAVGNTHALDARRILSYSIHGDISISFTLLRTRFALPPPLPVERPSLLKFLGSP